MTVFVVGCPEVLPMVRCLSYPTGPEVGLGNLQNRRSALVPVPTFPNSPANLVLGIFSTDMSMLETNVVGCLYPSTWPSVSPPCHYSELQDCCGQTEKQLWIGMSNPGHEISDISWTVPVLVYGSRYPWKNYRGTHSPCWREVSLMVSSVSIFLFYLKLM